MIVGFSGTRKGMSAGQVLQFMAVMKWLTSASFADSPEFHHGDAEGADTQADRIVRGQYLNCKIVKHPANGDPLERNRDIANSHVLIAAPESDTEQLRSGTWATVRYARAKGIPIVMLSRGTR